MKHQMAKGKKGESLLLEDGKDATGNIQKLSIKKTSQENVHKQIDDNEPATWQFYFAYSVFLSSVLCLVTVYKTWPETANDDENGSLSDYITVPTNVPTIGDAKKIGSLILKYKDNNYYSVFGAYFATYILLQSLCIPGSIVLSILAGYLFNSILALLIICTCSTLGASTFYIIIYRYRLGLLSLLNKLSGNSNRVIHFNEFVQDKIKKYRSNLFLCVFVLRATPVFPNWTINLCSPIINLPFKPFVLGTFFGVAPLSVIHVWTGRILNDLSNDQSLVNWQSILMTSLVAVSVILLVYIRQLNR